MAASRHLSVQSRICLCHCYKGSTEGDSEGSPVSSLCWAQPPQKFCRHQWEGIGILCTWFEWCLSTASIRERRHIGPKCRESPPPNIIPQVHSLSPTINELSPQPWNPHNLLRAYMYRTKHRNGICRITLFSNVSFYTASISLLRSTAACLATSTIP